MKKAFDVRKFLDGNVNYVPRPINELLINEPRNLAVRDIVIRIRAATRHSRIIVTRNPDGLDCAFYDTVAGKLPRSNVVGIYDGTHIPTASELLGSLK